MIIGETEVVRNTTQFYKTKIALAVILALGLAAYEERETNHVE